MRPGASLLVAGANGAGKTTLLRLLATTLRPTSGSLLIGGKDPSIDLLEVRQQLGLVSHKTHLYDDLSASQFLDITATLAGMPKDRERTEGLLERVGLAGRGNDVIRGFSAGMRKRLCFARLLLQDPSVVLLDEPYGQLDIAGGDFVDELVSDLKDAGKTLVVSTHQVERSGQLLEHGLVLSSGRMNWVGPASEAADALREALR